jgi:transposase
MANKTKNMLQIRRILQLLESGSSNRKIALQVGISRNTVEHYIKRFRASGKAFKELLNLDDELLSAVVYNSQSSPRKDDRYERLAPLLSGFVKELSRRGVTRLLLWHEYRNKDADGYSYQQFCEHINTYLQVHSSVMHLEHKPGQKTQMDFAGGKMSYLDQHSGEIIECPVLVAVLPFSGYTYAEALRNAALEHLIPSMGRCVEYFGGATEHVETDNMKQVVKKSNRYEPSFTDLAQQWSVHYNTSLLATRVAKPRDKLTVEKAVDIVYKRIFAPLRNHVFHSLEELNHHIKQCLENHNNALFQKKDYSRRELFLQEEKQLLKPLPAERFEVKYSVQAKVQKNYHVTLGQDWHHYSVPYQYIGKQTTIIYDSEHVEIFINNARIATHRRNYRSHDFTTLDFHMPERHRSYLETRGWNQEYFIKKAALIGTHFKAAITHVLSSRRFTEQSFNSCLGLLRLESKYGKERLEKASEMALTSGSISYTSISTILLNNRDKQIETPVAKIPKHENIRGNQTYLFNEN